VKCPLQPHEFATNFFIDRCLSSKKVVAALREAGFTVEVHEDHFAPDALDIDWLPQVGERQ
jgi:PIN like domain